MSEEQLVFLIRRGIAINGIKPKGAFKLDQDRLAYIFKAEIDYDINK